MIYIKGKSLEEVNNIAKDDKIEDNEIDLYGASSSHVVEYIKIRKNIDIYELSFGEIIRLLRKKKDISAAKLSEMLNRSHSYIGQIERNSLRTMKSERLKEIEKALQCENGLLIKIADYRETLLFIEEWREEQSS